MEPKDFIGKTVLVKFNKTNCPKAGTCATQGCDEFSPIGKIGVVNSVDEFYDEEPRFNINDGSIRWMCRCELVGEVEKKKECKDYPHACPRCGAPAYQGLTIVDCTKCGKF